MKIAAIRAIVTAFVVAMAPLANANVVLNEVAYEGVAGVCNGNNYVELLNTGSTTVDYTGYRLELDAGLASLLTYTFPSGSTLAPGAVVVHCQGSGSFQYGISFEDTMSLKSSTNALLSTTGPMWRPAGSTTYTYQRKATGKFRHFTPTPGNVTSTLSHGISPVLISEVAARPVGGWCNGDDYVELFNLARGPVDISGYLLFDQQGANSTQAYTFPDGSMIAGGQAVVYCQFNTFQFNISLDAVGSSWRSEQVTLRDEVGMLVSYTPITNGWRDYLTLQLDSTTMTYSYKYPSPGRDYKTNTVPVPPPTKAPGMHPTKAPTAQGQIVINEVSFTAYVGLYVAACPAGYVELMNDGSAVLDISGYKLLAFNGPTLGGSYVFPAETVFQPGQIKLFCKGTTFTFAVEETSTIKIRDTMNIVVADAGDMRGALYNYYTWQRAKDGEYHHFWPTPNRTNFEYSRAPTKAPTTKAPTRAPVRPPTKAPTRAPVRPPTKAPVTKAPTLTPVTKAPTAAPVKAPTKAPVKAPTVAPVKAPTSAPVKAPTATPLKAPTAAPAKAPSTAPVKAPTKAPFIAGIGGGLVITEVADKGVPNTCNGTADYIELHNSGSMIMSLAGYVLHDDQGPSSAEKYTFPAGSTIAPGQYLVLCQGTTFQFGISGNDSITIRDAMTAAVVSSTGPLTGLGSASSTYQRTASGMYSYYLPTPGTATTGATKSPTRAPTNAPVKAPSVAPLKAPSTAPVKAPTSVPVKAPTSAPVKAPTKAPTAAPVKAPTKAPVKADSTLAPAAKAPVKAPTAAPLKAPTSAPLKAPTSAPLKAPTAAPFKGPTNAPKAPTLAPKAPTSAPVTVSSPVRAPVKSPTAAPIQPLEVVRLVVCDGKTGAEVMQLSRTGRSVVSPKKLKAKYFMIKAEVVGVVGSVVFEFDGEKHMENKAPFMFGEKKPAAFVVGSLYAKLPVIRQNFPRNKILAGNHVIKATPFASSDGTGPHGNPLSVKFRVDRRFQIFSSA